MSILYNLNYTNNVVKTGKYKGINYVIKTLGYYPTAYVSYEIPESWEEECPVSISYRTVEYGPLSALDKSKEWTGWDYCHQTDCYTKFNETGRKYTIKDILVDIKKVINFIKEKEK